MENFRREENNEYRVVTATVIFPVFVDIRVNKNTPNDEIEEKIFNYADNILQTSTVKPIIHDCSDPDLIS